MLTFPLPSHVNGDLLVAQLQAAGVPSSVYVVENWLALPMLNEPHRTTAQPVVDAHPATALALANTEATARANESTIRDQAAGAIAGNKTFLAIASPTNAQTLAQVKALTRVQNGLIRLALRSFESTD